MGAAYLTVRSSIRDFKAEVASGISMMPQVEQICGTGTIFVEQSLVNVALSVGASSAFRRIVTESSRCKIRYVVTESSRCIILVSGGQLGSFRFQWDRNSPRRGSDNLIGVGIGVTKNVALIISYSQ